MYSKRIEDYLEAIYNITQRKGYARTKDIAKELDIKPPSVTETLKKLKEENLVIYEKYSGVTLTRTGEKIGRSVKHRHETIKRFLKMLLIPEKVAETDACKLEHDLSPESIEQLGKFLKYVEDASLETKLPRMFEEYCRNMG